MVGILLNSCSQRQNSNDSPLSHIKDQSQLDWSTGRKACDAIHKTAGILVFTEDALEQLRSTVCHSRLLADTSRSGHRYAKPNNSLRRRQPCRSVSDFWCVPATKLCLCLEEQFGAAASASGENLLEDDATGLDTGALRADQTILPPPPPVVYCSRWIEQR